MITKNGNTFHLKGKEISYIIVVGEHGDLLHYHYGRQLKDKDYAPYAPQWPLWTRVESEGYSLEFIEQEYPSFGHLDFRQGVYQVIFEDGSDISRFQYQSHRIYKGKQPINGMPSVVGAGANVHTLEITVVDQVTGLSAILYYSVFEEYNVICRRVMLQNTTQGTIELKNAMSASIDLRKKSYEVIHFSGAWARECEMNRNNMTQGSTLEISSCRGGSGHQVNPFVMVCDKGASETTGEVYGFSLVYSGDHATLISSDQHGSTRVQMGINPRQFTWSLDTGECFETPECILAYSPQGFGGISKQYHSLFDQQLIRSKRAKQPRPVLINNWEGTYFDFTEDKLLAIAEKAKEVGCELFVLDDGWFGKRNHDRCSLGDWYVNEEKLPCGISGLAQKMNNLGLDFGLWFEPEMVNPDSDLYRSHPDWVIRTANREPALSRGQLILDLAKEEVCDYVIEAVGKILESANISYVKWDMNRNMTDRPYIGYNHRYILGLYKILESLTSRFSDVLFEGCASGGGRFDPGMLYYMPQIWTSDNSDAIARLKIQYGTSFAYPISSISAHVTDSPNHQNGRLTTLKTRAAVAFTGAFGYELDPCKLEIGEIDIIKEQIKEYKALRDLVQNGEFYRIASPFEGNITAWQIVSKDKRECYFMVCKELAQVNVREEIIMLQGLDAEIDYKDSYSGEIYSGSELMHRGIDLVFKSGDFNVQVFHFIGE